MENFIINETINSRFLTMETNIKSKSNSYYDSYSALYCLDAQYEGYNPLYAERFLLDSSHGLKVKAFDVAVMSVLVDNGILGTPSASNITDYWERLVAIRGLLYTFGLYN